MELAEVKEALQEFFTDDLVTVIGSGLSVAEGLPSMGELEDHLNTEIPRVADTAIAGQWSPISASLGSGVGIEKALHDHPPGEELEDLIVRVTTEFVLPREVDTIVDVISGNRELRLSKLLRFITPNWKRPPTVITTNYDRLIELAAELDEIGVDSEFVGQHVGFYDPDLSKRMFVRDVTHRNRLVKVHYRNRLCLCKPHGSFDWYLNSGVPVRCSLELDLPRLIITPGAGKYRKGYETPFDKHRERGNNAIGNAGRLLCIGYGFNDDHLQTHLLAKIRSGANCLVITRSRTEALEKIIESNPNVTVVSYQNDGSKEGTEIVIEGKTLFFEGIGIWDLDNFVEEVLAP